MAGLGDRSMIVRSIIPDKRSIGRLIMSIRHVDPTTKEVTETFVGAVLDEYEDNGYHDSYGHALVWDAEKGTVHTESTWSTAYYTTTSATVDATPESIEAARMVATKILAANMIENHKIVGPGKSVKSLTTKGKAKGVTGTVVRFEESKFQSAWEARYSPRKVAVVKVDNPEHPSCGRNVYVAPDRLEVTDELTPDVETDYRQEAWLIAHKSDIRSLFHPKFGILYRVAELYR